LTFIEYFRGSVLFHYKSCFLLSGISILVAEDNLVNQKIANYILSKQGATVTTAMNGQEAINMLQDNNIDVILMDLQMPGLDGLEAAKYIRREMKNNVPIIALTADLFASETNECIEAGINACISKPFDPVALCDLILNLISNGTNTF